MGEFKDSFYHFVWHLNDLKRATICLPFGVLMFLIGWWLGWGWEISFLCGWILAIGTYLVLLNIVIFTADAASTRERISHVDPTRWLLLIVLTLGAVLGTICVGIILTAVGQRSSAHTRLFVLLSIIAVILSWFLLHTAFGQHYSRLYYDDTDRFGHPFPEGLRRGFTIPGTPEPTYLDFMYISFTLALTYAMSDVNVTNELQRRVALCHAIISFFFYSTILGVVLNAVVTSL